MRRLVKKGFTLVEILIVVVILGILAAVVVPQFTNATQDAQAGNLKAQKKSIQNQIELFKARTGSYPTLTQMQTAPANGSSTNWGVLIDGGYVKQAPKNPHNGLDTIDAGTLATNGVDMAGVAATGWAYDETTGSLSPCYFNETTEVIDPANP
jgi:general secretion pathway protein G